MNRAWRVIGPVVIVVLCVSLVGGCASRTNSQPGTVSGGVSGGMVATPPEIATDKTTSGQSYGGGAPDGVGASAGAPVGQEAPARDALVITTAGMTLEVRALDSAVASIRTIASKYGASIDNLTVSAGGGTVGPQPLDSSAGGVSAPTPGSASITLRIPAAKLDAAEKELTALGTVKSQTSSQDDVTQQHVDMAARLKNLRAEEARLRSFFSQAKRVSEMLSIEEQLSRVRGEIESMQAQIAYLERQAARATLTITLTEPGALVSPGSGGWGFAQAFRDGVRAAAGVTTTLITLVLAMSPVLLLALVLWFVIRAAVRSRRRRRASEQADFADPSADSPSTPIDKP